MAENITELSSIEFRNSLGEAFKAYSDELEALSRRWSIELEMAATDSRAAMSRLHGHPLLFGLDTRVRARRVAKRLQRAQELADGIAAEGRRFHRDYVKHFTDQARRS